MAVTRPTTDDLIGWLKLQTPPDQATQDVYDECMDCALDEVESRIDLPAGTTNDNYPQRVRTAILLTAARLAKRSTSPEGVAGMSDIGAVVRILPRDPDVEKLLLRYMKVNGFS